MITGYKDIYYNVTDMKRAVEFYRALGLNPVFQDEYWSTLILGNLTLGLHASDAGNIPLTIRNSHGQESGGTLTLQSDDVDADRKLLESLGAKILGEDDAPWGHMLVFEDLDGNVLKLMNPKY